MGGGLINNDRLPELGNFPKDSIRNLFLTVLGSR